MDKNDVAIVHQALDKKQKDAETTAIVTQTEDREISLPLSEQTEKISPKTEIDLTHAPTGLNHMVHTAESDGSDEFIPEKTGEKQKLSQENSRISIMDPNDEVFQTEARPAEVDQKKNLDQEVTKEKSSYSTKSQTGKLPVSEVGGRKPLKKKTAPRKAIPKPTGSISQPISIGKGVAYLSGNMIKLIGGVKLSPGEEIKIKDKEYVLRSKPRKNTIIYVSAVCLLILGLLLFTPFFKSHDSGRLIGMVMQENTRMSIPTAKILLKETGKTIKSNELGFFMFEFLPPGMYTLEISSTGHKPKRENITITKDQSTTISVQLSPLTSGDLSSGSPFKVASPQEGSQQTSSSDVSATDSDYGAIRIKSNVSDPMILVDNHTAGTGNKIYKKIEPGRHVVTAIKEGYYDWAQEVNVAPGKTLNLEVTFSDDKNYHSAPQTWKDYASLGQTQLNSNDFSSALNSYNQALALKPDAPDALSGRGQTYLQMGEKTKALEDLEKSAQLYMNASDYQNAALGYSDLLVLKDRDPGYFLNRGICYLQLGQYQKSVQDLKQATELDPKLCSGYLSLGEAYCKAGDYKLSIETYKQARKLNPNSPQVFIGLTKAYYAKKDKSEAKKSYKKLEELSTYIDREKMKEDSEWRGILKEIGVE